MRVSIYGPNSMSFQLVFFPQRNPASFGAFLSHGAGYPQLSIYGIYTHDTIQR